MKTLILILTGLMTFTAYTADLDSTPTAEEDAEYQKDLSQFMEEEGFNTPAPIATEEKTIHLKDGSVGQQLGLQPGDILSEINGKKAADDKKSKKMISQLNKPGKYQVKVLHGGQLRQIQLTIEE